MTGKPTQSPSGPSGRRMQVFRMGIDPAKGTDQNAYWCRECGPTSEPCNHLNSFIKRQQVDGELRRQRRG